MELSEPDKAAVLYMEVAKIHEVRNPGNYIVLHMEFVCGLSMHIHVSWWLYSVSVQINGLPV